jgi:hypothetical protein
MKPLNRADLVDELRKLEEECSKPNWDGYNAYPVDKESMRYAVRFIVSLPEDAPLPEASVEPEGTVSLDWSDSRDSVLSVSVMRTGTLIYARRWVDDVVRGSVILKPGEGIPETLLSEIGRFGCQAGGCDMKTLTELEIAHWQRIYQSVIKRVARELYGDVERIWPLPLLKGGQSSGGLYASQTTQTSPTSINTITAEVVALNKSEERPGLHGNL